MTDSCLPSRIVPLDSLRGLFACCILYFHCGDKHFMQLATGGVVFFFVLSGFVLDMHHDAQLLRGAAHARFMKQKALRIFPLHWLSLAVFTILTLLVSERGIYWKALLPNALLLQSYIPLRDYYFSFNVVSWFLCDILLCYLCYPFLARGLKGMKLKSQLFLLLLLFLSYCSFMYPWQLPDDEAVVTWSHVFPLFRLFEFSMGIVAHHVFVALKDKNFRLTPVIATCGEWAVLLLLGALVIADQWHHEWFGANYDDSIMWEIPMTMLVLVLAFTNDCKGLVSRVLVTKPLVWLGTISMELFLFQAIAGRLYGFVVCPVLGHWGYEDCYANYWLILPLLIAIAWLVNRLFTRPLQARWRVQGSKKRESLQ